MNVLKQRDRRPARISPGDLAFARRYRYRLAAGFLLMMLLGLGALTLVPSAVARAYFSGVLVAGTVVALAGWVVLARSTAAAR